MLLNESHTSLFKLSAFKNIFQDISKQDGRPNHRVFSLDVFFPVSSICRRSRVKHIFLASVNRNGVTRDFKKGVEITYESP